MPSKPEVKKKWYEANRARQILNAKRWRAANPERRKEQVKRSRIKHKTKYDAYQRQYMKYWRKKQEVLLAIAKCLLQTGEITNEQIERAIAAAGTAGTSSSDDTENTKQQVTSLSAMG